LLRHELSLDLVHYVVSLVVLKVTLHNDLLSELARSDQDVFIVVVGVCQELLVTKCHKVSFLMVNIILVLVSELNDLFILSHNELRPFHDSSLIEVWHNQEFVE
jgi:Na+-transporting NADH:ubiquinone oxidoreductase subunit NqrD